ncbi:uncharacterized protein LOC131266334 [Anopheles coustani]|uniref:uncharacterized protein LOC131266334 n=1 Tax=Anopheles coustani TaxID=139045 RepID=UPI002657B23B|nr:uncharacterized protein LOC131266334 [Anopheles coustani]
MVNLQEILKSIRSLGCNDEAICCTTYRIYVHLSEERKFHDVRYYYDENLNGIYLTAKREEHVAKFEVFLPVQVPGELCLLDIAHYRKVVKRLNLEEKDTIVLAICDSSSTVLLYEITAGLHSLGKRSMMKC